MKPFQIFKAGRHVASDGTVVTFSGADIAASVAAYDPSLHEAPLVKGHPKTDAPAYGWVQSLEKRGGVMFAAPRQVDLEFAEDVQAGRWKKRSASFYSPDHPNNPVPGVYYLKHVGFLGAMPPAVKGMPDPEFAEGEDGVLVFSEALDPKEFGDWGDRVNAGLWRRLRDWFIGERGLEEADKIIPDYEVNTLATEAVREESVPVGFSEASQPTHKKETATMPTPEELAAKEAEIKKQEEALAAQAASFAEREEALRKKEADARRAEVAEFVEGMVKEGRVLPVHRDGLVEFMAAIPSDAVVEFGEGDEAVKTPSLGWFRAFVGSLPKQVEFGEIVKDDGAPLDTDDAHAIAKAAVEFQESEAQAGRVISTADAVQHVTTKGAK
jgi:hypothetical protein